MEIIVTEKVNGYDVVGDISARYVWRVAGEGTGVAYQSGTDVFSGRPRWSEVKPSQDVSGMDLYQIVC